MTVNRTTLLDLPLPVTGTESGTWGDTTNNGLTQYMDIAIAGMSNLTSANFTAGALTIETTEGDSSATNISATSAQYAGFRVSSLAVNSTITVGNTGTSPARSYRLINADATYNLTFKATGQTGVTLLPGQSAVVAFNGTDYVIVGTVGAGTATDNAVARFDGTTGEILQNSAATIDDTGAATFVGSVNVSGTSASGADLKLYEDTDNGTNYVAFKSPASVASNVTWTLPSADGSANQAIVTNGSGTLSFASVTTSPGGSTTQVQYNNAGAFGGSANFVWDNSNVRLGIGTSSPGYSLTAAAAPATSANYTFADFGRTTGANSGIGDYIAIQKGSDAANYGAVFISGTGWGSSLIGNAFLQFNTGVLGSQTERMRIDTSGNVGIGVTPPTVSQGRLLSLAYSGSGISVTSGADVSFTNNAYYNTAWKYGQNGLSARFQLTDDQFIFFNATTGTAGNNITWSERMRINASGNVGIGTSSPSTLGGGGLTLGTTSTGKSLIVYSSSDGSTGLIQFIDKDAANAFQINGNSVNIGLYGYGSRPMIFYTNDTERMRISTAGGLSVGSTIDPGSGSILVPSNGTIFGNNSSNSRSYIELYNSSTGDMSIAATYTSAAIKFLTGGTTTPTERARFVSTFLLIGATSEPANSNALTGIALNGNGTVEIARSDAAELICNRKTTDGALVIFRQDGNDEGSISVSGNTISYNAFAGSHWSQVQDGSKPDILRGTVMESINELCVWPGEQNERMPKSKISDTAGSKKVYGVFMAWDNDWTETNDMYVTAVGAFICRVNGGVTVQEGDLLESNGDGTARVQADDIIRSSTIGKVISTVKTHEYDDGSYCVPTVLYCG